MRRRSVLVVAPIVALTRGIQHPNPLFPVGASGNTSRKPRTAPGHASEIIIQPPVLFPMCPGTRRAHLRGYTRPDSSGSLDLDELDIHEDVPTASSNSSICHEPLAIRRCISNMHLRSIFPSRWFCTLITVAHHSHREIEPAVRCWRVIAPARIMTPRTQSREKQQCTSAPRGVLNVCRGSFPKRWSLVPRS